MKINGIGSALVDNLYSPVDFTSHEYQRWSAENNNGTGIITGGLVFREDLEKLGGKPYRDIIEEITGKNSTSKKNVGGPSIVTLIHVMQMLGKEKISIRYFGTRGDDENGRYLAEKINSFSIDTSGYLVREGQTPFTDVLIDPSYNQVGERSFITSPGTAGVLTGKDLPVSFFDADVLVFGGTALTTGIHDDLSMLLERGHASGCRTFVNTVYDFRNEKLHPDRCWPLVKTDRYYRMIDLLITDNEEALRISGQRTKKDALDFFSSKGVGSVIITHGPQDVACVSNGTFFMEKGTCTMPVSCAVDEERKKIPPNILADTTGCGDNFAGGVYALVIQQMEHGRNKPSLKQAVSWGIVSGGFTSLYEGGVYYEKTPGEKRGKIEHLFEAYKKQTGGNFEESGNFRSR